MGKKKPISVNDYINLFPDKVATRLKSLRKLMLETIPDTEEYMGYDMPGYKFKGKAFVYFAAFSKHIGLYGMNIVPDEFKEKAAQFKSGKGSIQFPNEEELPLDLIRAIIEHKVQRLV